MSEERGPRAWEAEKAAINEAYRDHINVASPMSFNGTTYLMKIGLKTDDFANAKAFYALMTENRGSGVYVRPSQK